MTTRRPSFGFPLLIASTALIVLVVALLAAAFNLSDMHGGATGSGGVVGTMHGPMMGGAVGAATPEGSGRAESVRLVIRSDEEHGRRGPEGAWHDAYLPASFAVDPGSTVTVTVLNYDEAEHTFTSMPLGLNVTVAAGSASGPKATTFTFQAPEGAGDYPWFCAVPCDPWAMAHIGYMRGYVRVA